MKTLILITLLTVFEFLLVHAANAQECKVEIYLLKRVIPNADGSNDIRKAFNCTVSDLQDTVFIKDSEIRSYIIKTDSSLNSQQSLIHYLAEFKVKNAAAQRVQKLTPSLCCGTQFVVVAYGKIAYTGYFWSVVSSFRCDWTTALSFDNIIDIMTTQPAESYIHEFDNPRKNELLLDCLKSTNRLITE